jgi:translocator protein
MPLVSALKRCWPWLILWLVAVFVVGATGSWVTIPKIATWYAGLAKPWFTPPNAVFGPVWTLLYAAMAVAAFRVSCRPASPQRRRALVLFALQLALNALWSPSFFGMEAPRLGLVVIIALVIAVAFTLIAFLRLDRLAGLLLVPYLLWVGYASLLNAAVVRLN